MTAFAIDFGRTRATVVSDSLAYMPDRHEVKPLGFIQKVMPIPHLKAVLFSRGQYEITARAWSALMIPLTVRTIEDAAAQLPEMFRQIADGYCIRQGIDDYRGVGLLEAVLLGWSAEKKRMRFWQFLNWRDFTAEGDDGAMYGVMAFPRLPATHMPRVGTTATDGQLVDVVKAIDRWFKDEPEINCGQRVGGEVLSVEITPKGMVQRVLHRFDSYETDRHAAAAVATRIERGDLDASRIVADGLVSVADMVDSATGRPPELAADQRHAA